MRESRELAIIKAYFDSKIMNSLIFFLVDKAVLNRYCTDLVRKEGEVLRIENESASTRTSSQ